MKLVQHKTKLNAQSHYLCENWGPDALILIENAHIPHVLPLLISLHNETKNIKGWHALFLQGKFCYFAKVSSQVKLKRKQKQNKSNAKCQNTPARLNQYTAPNSKLTGGVQFPPLSTDGGECPTLKCGVRAVTDTNGFCIYSGEQTGYQLIFHFATRVTEMSFSLLENRF